MKETASRRREIKLDLLRIDGNRPAEQHRRTSVPSFAFFFLESALVEEEVGDLEGKGAVAFGGSHLQDAHEVSKVVVPRNHRLLLLWLIGGQRRGYRHEDRNNAARALAKQTDRLSHILGEGGVGRARARMEEEGWLVGKDAC